jgi:hypothetical protein
MKRQVFVVSLEPNRIKSFQTVGRKFRPLGDENEEAREAFFLGRTKGHTQE